MSQKWAKALWIKNCQSLFSFSRHLSLFKCSVCMWIMCVVCECFCVLCWRTEGLCRACLCGRILGFTVKTTKKPRTFPKLELTSCYRAYCYVWGMSDSFVCLPMFKTICSWMFSELKHCNLWNALYFLKFACLLMVQHYSACSGRKMPSLCQLLASYKGICGLVKIHLSFSAQMITSSMQTGWQ